MNFQCSNELKLTFQVLKTTVLSQLLCFPCEINVLLSDELEDCMRKITLKKISPLYNSYKYGLSNSCNKTSLGDIAFTLQIFSSR